MNADDLTECSAAEIKSQALDRVAARVEGNNRRCRELTASGRRRTPEELVEFDRLAVPAGKISRFSKVSKVPTAHRPAGSST